MYTKGKYLVGEIQDLHVSNLGVAIIAENFGHSALKRVFIQDSIISGGYFYIDENKQVVCYGDSVSCGVKHNSRHDILVVKALGLYNETL